MATLNQLLKEQVELIGAAKKALAEAQNKPPPPNAPSDLKAATVKELKARVRNLERARDAVERQITAQIEAYSKEIRALE